MPPFEKYHVKLLPHEILLIYSTLGDTFAHFMERHTNVSKAIID